MAAAHTSGGRLITVLFVVLISVPFIGTFFGWDFHPPGDENRLLAEPPRLLSLPLAAWPGSLDAYCNDHIGFRNTFIRRHRKLMQDVFHRESDRVLEGRDGWLYLKDNGNISDFLGLRPLTEEKMRSLRVSFEGRQRWLERQGIHHLFVIPPNKPVIYPEHLPEAILKARGTDGILQFRNWLERDAAALNVLDLRDELLARKPEGLLYFPNDTHWTYLGSYFAYCAVIERLKRRFPGLQPLGRESCVERDSQWKGDLVAMLGDGRPAIRPCVEIVPDGAHTHRLQEAAPDEIAALKLPDGISGVRISRNPDGTGRIVIIHDSFARQGWFQFFPLHFKETVFLATLRPPIGTYRWIIEAFHPDVIVDEQIHRNVLHKPQPVCEEWAQALER